MSPIVSAPSSLVRRIAERLQSDCPICASEPEPCGSCLADAEGYVRVVVPCLCELEEARRVLACHFSSYRDRWTSHQGKSEYPKPVDFAAAEDALRAIATTAIKEE